VTLTIKISPPTNLTGTAWNKANNKSGSFTIPFPQTAANILATDNNWTWGGWDDIGYIKMPVGTTTYLYNCGDIFITTIITGNENKIPITNQSCNGVDYITTLITNTSASFSPSSVQNTFQSSGNLVSLNTGSGTYGIEDINGLEIQATFPFEGIIILPAGISTTNVLLKNLNGVVGNISQTYTFSKTSTSPQIQFTTAPTSQISTTNVGTNYYYTQAPAQIYITGSFDNGFNSGSSNLDNWYFERGNKAVSGSQFLLMTASYDLSKLYYDHYIPGGQYYGNSMIQIVPTQSILLGYQDITEYFNPKKGDLVRFYNYDSGKFPFSSTFEREITNIYLPNQIIGTGSNGTGSYEGRLVFEVAEDHITANIPNQACINNPSGSTIGHILDFIILSKIPDETNIIIVGNKKPGQTSAGIVIPENVNKDLKKEAGNIIKNLKSQNLI
jgi:hypothetical protein